MDSTRVQNYIHPQLSWHRTVLLDDLDSDCLAHKMKRWADKYKCSGKIKGGKVSYKPVRDENGYTGYDDWHDEVKCLYPSCRWHGQPLGLPKKESHEFNGISLPILKQAHSLPKKSPMCPCTADRRSNDSIPHCAGRPIVIVLCVLGNQSCGSSVMAGSATKPPTTWSDNALNCRSRRSQPQGSAGLLINP